MVCDRCIMVVRNLFEENGYVLDDVQLGKVIIREPGNKHLGEIATKLEDMGFAIVEKPDRKLVEQVKALLISYLNTLPQNKKAPNLSEFITKEIPHTYPTISRKFSASEGISIEQYLIRLKIEKVKELLSYGEKNLTEIAWDVKYSSVQHLSGQFRKVTGKTVTEFINDQKRTTLDNV